MAATIQMLAVRSLRPYRANSRVHSDEQLGQLVASIREFGFTAPVVVTEDQEILAGHGRVMAAQRLGMAEVPCVVVSGLSEMQRRAYVIADNKIASNAEWDEDVLRSEAASLFESGFEAVAVGFSPEELEGLAREEPSLTERTEKLRPVKYVRMLVSIPVGSTVDGVEDFVGRVSLAGGRIDYAGN